MSIDYLGWWSFGAAADATTGDSVPPLCPLVWNAFGAASVALTAAYDGALALNAQFSITPPTLVATLSALVEFEAQCALGISLSTPSVSFDATASAQLVADLTASFGFLVAVEALLALPVTVGWFGYPWPLPGAGLPAAIGLSGLVPYDSAIVMGAVDIPLLTANISRQKLEQFLPGISYPGVGVFSNLADMSPVTLSAIPQARAAIEYQLGLAVKLDAFVKVNPPTLTASIEAAAKFAANLQAAASLALPKVQFALDATAKLSASLNAQFDALIQLGLALNRPDGRLFIYRWTDTGLGLGTDLSAQFLADGNCWGDQFTPVALPCEAAVLVTDDPVSWTALVDSAGAFFGGAA